MFKRLFSSVLLASCILGVSELSLLPLVKNQIADAQTSNDLHYNFYGQQIPLTVRQDAIAVSFQQPMGVRGGAGGREPLYLRLQRELQTGATGVRGARVASTMEVEVKPVGTDYALIKLPSGTRGSTAMVAQQVQQKPYIESALPVVTRSGSNDNIVLPNEVLLSFEPGMAESQILTLLNRYNLDIVRPLRFTNNRYYIVKPRTASGTAVLNVANRLNRVTGIKSATPNFVQIMPQNLRQPFAEDVGAQHCCAPTPNAVQQLTKLLASLPQPKGSPLRASLLPLQWHLNSTPQRGQLQPRIDVRATEAWRHSSGGKGVVVAVLDSSIQWDHPDLANNVYTVGDVPGKFPGEVHGWDFAQDDADTRISEQEIESVRESFQDTFKLSSGDFIQKYFGGGLEAAKQQYPNQSVEEIADIGRRQIRNNVAYEFHGTMVAGIIAAQGQNQQGALGVAPNAKILPVRVFGLGGAFNSAKFIEALGYAASRGADVINMSLGGALPVEGEVDQIFELMDKNPNLVIVASAGNEDRDGAGFPAAIPGIVSVGATNMNGIRTDYSNFGGRLDVVAPGGDTQTFLRGGILTTGGTWVDGFWQGMNPPDYSWGITLDPKGAYAWTEGTSFSAPIVSGVFALMKGENRNLSRDRAVSILKQTSSYETLTMPSGEANFYRMQGQVGLTSSLRDRLSGIFPLPNPKSPQEYFYGRGLVNADAAVRVVKEGR